MSTATTTREICNDEAADTIEHRLSEVRDHLREMRRRLDEEIRRYPTPIPRCDAQFNHLFEQRARLNRVLDRLDSIAGKRAESIELIEEFVRSPAYLDEAGEAELRRRLGAELSRLTS
jgi:hypothetical protein